MSQIFKDLEQVIAVRQKQDAPCSYTRRLLKERMLVERKINEEAYELIEAAFIGEKDKILYEAADLLFHFLVFLRKYDLGLEDIEKELMRRKKE
jgi:phosphoribosyl-ATP pyrophosphohydrolase